MDGGIGWVILILVVAWAANQIWQGYRRETAPPLTMSDNGHGVMDPVCPRCQARLVAVQRSTSSGLASALAILIGLAGIILILFNWIAGGVIIILAILIHMAGREKQTALTCPACRTDARILD